MSIRHHFFRALLGPGLFSGTVLAANLDCMVKPEMYVELSSPVAGTVEALLVDKGDHVAKGQPLAQLEASVEWAKFNQAKADAETNSEVRNQKVKLEYATRNRARYRSLATTSVISQIEKDKVETEVVLAGIELKKAEERKKSAMLALEMAEAQLEVKTIKSPIDGIVIDRYAMPGESVSDRAIMKLAQVNPLRVELIAPTEYFGLIQPGMEVDVRPELPVKKVVKATVTKVDQLIDPASGSFTVRMTLPNPSDELIGGVNCIATFDFATPAATTTPTPPPFAPQNAAPAGPVIKR
ncbi:efflux RND transporter periplasmic adaptor subunit [Methylomonas sp. MO1]|uniref:efflux RND transporter periplasmic adaptor subunit n=1 Tax=Methylomonas sp. MO1 TaxID=3073619 RepID=UPI0028A34B91|nr:efflux RND transporter periplasmic adaptor subunit [Methylomonas sp. MO1]MDT4290567.1 efflux RND transporter periplasmic adaptor subunit [Methylomonas sp. MO1]